MSIRRFFLPPEKLSEAEPSLTGREATHAAKVLRLKPRDRLEILDGAGRACRCEVTRISKASVHLRKHDEILTSPPPTRVHLHAAILRGKAMDNLVQKATELGVHAIHPLLTARCEVRLKSADWPVKRDKWMQVAIESIKQCGSTWLPILTEPAGITGESAAGFVNVPEAFSLVAALTERTTTIRRAFAEMNPPPADVHIWIGPEGDFTQDELNLLINAGAYAVTLGQNVLRADTAATVAAALVLHETTVIHTLPADTTAASR